MKVSIVTNIGLDLRDIVELEEMGVSVAMYSTRAELKTKLNPYFGEIWGDFDWLRSQFTEPTDVRAFVTSREQMRANGIKGHIGMYDVVDGDKTHDLYVGLPAKLDARAKTNGFRSNLTWMVVHEICHGEEQAYPGPDRTHAMEEQGRLKELWREHQVNRIQLEKEVNALQWTVIGLIGKLITKLLVSSKKPSLYQTASKYLGVDASPDDVAPDLLGCADSVSNIIHEVIPDFPIITGTWTLWDRLEKDERFRRVTIPMPGTVIISPTISETQAVRGHVGIFGQTNKIMSNNSYTGEWEYNYTYDSWRERYEGAGLPVYMYQLIT